MVKMKLLIVCRHAKKPVIVDHEIICADCGVVLDTIEEGAEFKRMDRVYGQDSDIHQQKAFENLYPGLEKMLLPLTIQNKIGFWRDNFDKPIMNYYRVYDRLLGLASELKLPIFYAKESMRIILKSNKGLYSYKWQIRAMIQAIENANDKRLDAHLKVLEEKIKHVQGI